MLTEDLQGKVALVTGSSRGLGRHYALLLAQAGADVIIHDINAQAAATFGEAPSGPAVADEIRAFGRRSAFLSADLTDAAQTEALLQQSLDQFEHIDILVNNAGGDIGAVTPRPEPNDALDISVNDIRSVIDRSLLTTLLACKYFGRHMRERHSGKIVNVGSVAGHVPVETGIIYAAAKIAISHYTRCLAEELRPYECDGLTAFRQLPMAVVLPHSEAQICEILAICRRLDVPVVARGSGTGLSGGAMPHAGGVILSLARLNRILELDPVARTARVQPGVRNLQVSEAAAPHGLYYAPDPSSQIACSIGGNVAENSGGVHCLKYGLTVHNVMRVRGYTIDGELLELGSGALDCPGLDLLALAIGSEGLLMVVTEITVKLIPRPQLAQLVMASFDDVAKAGEAVAAIIAAGIIPAGLEMMDRKATAAVEPFVKAGKWCRSQVGTKPAVPSGLRGLSGETFMRLMALAAGPAPIVTSFTGDTGAE